MCRVKSSQDSSYITYQWYVGEIAEGIAIEGEVYSAYTMPIISEIGIHNYYCVVTENLIDNGDGGGTKLYAIPFTVACTGLPTIVINTENSDNPTAAKEKHNGRMYLFRNGKIVYDSGNENDFSIKVRGNSSVRNSKLPYKLKLPKKANLFDANDPLNSTENKDKNYVLLAGAQDKTLLRTKTGFYISQLFNLISGNTQLYVPNSEFVDVILNGEYIGNYTLTDSVKEGRDRLPVNEKVNSGGIGFVAEYDKWYFNEEKYFMSAIKEFPYTFKFPNTDDSNFNDYMGDFESYINRFETALYISESGDDWTNYIDIESFARWFLVQNILANMDPNYFLSKKSTADSSKLVMGPGWDYDWCMGIGFYEGNRPGFPDYFSVNKWYFPELLTKNEFKWELKNQWQKLNERYPNLAEIIINERENVASEIAVSRQMNFKKWDIINSQVYTDEIPLGSYEAEIDCDNQFIVKRIDWLNNAITELHCY